MSDTEVEITLRLTIPNDVWVREYGATDVQADMVRYFGIDELHSMVESGGLGYGGELATKLDAAVTAQPASVARELREARS